LSILIDVETLSNKIRQGEDFVFIIDVRPKGNSDDSAIGPYEQGHIPNALYLDPTLDLTGENSFFPEAYSLGEKLGKLGIGNEATIVLYDDGKNRNSAKAWATLYFIGHNNLYILQGGFKAWLHASKPVSTEVPTFTSTNYKISPREDMVKTIDEIKKGINNPNKVLIDSRAKERYTGEREPKYAKAGHIPNAKNYTAKEVFNDKGLWKSKEELQRHFSPLEHDEEIIVSCGTGTSACLNMVALIEAGYSNVKIYPGGFKEWIDENNPVATGGE